MERRELEKLEESFEARHFLCVIAFRSLTTRLLKNEMDPFMALALPAAGPAVRKVARCSRDIRHALEQSSDDRAGRVCSRRNAGCTTAPAR